MTSRPSWITHFLSSIIVDWEDKPKGTCNFLSSHIKYEQGPRKTNSSSLFWQHDEDEEMKVEHRSSKRFKWCWENLEKSDFTMYFEHTSHSQPPITRAYKISVQSEKKMSRKKIVLIQTVQEVNPVKSLKASS